MTQPYKAVVAFALAFAAALLASIQGRPTLDGMGAVDWIVVILGAVVTAGAVWATRNPPTGA